MAPKTAIELKILSDAFLKLISMIVAPIGKSPRRARR
jgi:Na+/H+-dicarboxylate symporter